MRPSINHLLPCQVIRRNAPRVYVILVQRTPNMTKGPGDEVVMSIKSKRSVNESNIVCEIFYKSHIVIGEAHDSL